MCVLPALCFCSRLKYDADDDKAILCGLLMKGDYKKFGGNAIWKEFEQLKVWCVSVNK